MEDTSPFGNVELTTLLADFASVAEGKLTVVGAGWDITGGPMPTAVGGLAHVPYHMANTEFVLSVELWDFDGAPVLLQGMTTPLRLEQRLVASPTAAAKRGQDLKVPFAINIGPLPLEPGRYQWRITVDGHNEARWNLSFTLNGELATA